MPPTPPATSASDSATASSLHHLVVGRATLHFQIPFDESGFLEFRLLKTMKSQDLADGKQSRGGKKSIEKASQMERKVKPTDMIWVKNRGGLWWPGQVVDENLVSESLKQGKRSAGKVLVRLYGTYTYSYVDPNKWRSEFDMILEQNNGSYREIFRKSLEHDVARLRADESKRQRSKSKGNKEGVGQKKKKPNNNQSAKQGDESDDNALKKRKPNSSSPETMSCSKSQELSARRIRVMQSLGLAAPPGSPFCRNGQINVTL